MAKDGTARGGSRPGQGRPKKAFAVKIDLIATKSLSKFARNTIDSQPYHHTDVQGTRRRMLFRERKH